MSKRIILVGKGAAGKDHLRQKFVDRGFKYATSYTTRPSREGEVNGTDYNFISKEKFEKHIQLGFWYEYVSFNKWYYGTSKVQFRNDDIFIMTPSGVAKLDKEDRKQSFIIYIDIPEYIRRERLMARGDVDGVERRLAADEKDFEDFIDFDLRFSDSDF